MQHLWRIPIVQAPMAGGTDTPALAAAVSNAGGLGSLGCAYLSPAQIGELAATTRALTSRAFSLNLFVRGEPERDASAVARVTPILDGFRAELGLSALGAVTANEPVFADQLAAAIAAAPAAISFTFGAPTREQVSAVRNAGIVAIGTATTVAEGDAFEALGIDAICAQGGEAGGHRGTFLGRFEDAVIGTFPLVRQLVARVRVPVLAAGGIMDGRGVRAAFDLGAVAAQLGTAFMACPEAGTAPAHRAALATATITTITRAFSGRPARGIANRMTEAFTAVAAAPFPIQQALTAELRKAAAAAGRSDLMQMWAGQGAPLARALPAAALVRAIAEEAGLVV